MTYIEGPDEIEWEGGFEGVLVDLLEDSQGHGVDQVVAPVGLPVGRHHHHAVAVREVPVYFTHRTHQPYLPLGNFVLEGGRGMVNKSFEICRLEKEEVMSKFVIWGTQKSRWLCSYGR